MDYKLQYRWSNYLPDYLLAESDISLSSSCHPVTLTDRFHRSSLFVLMLSSHLFEDSGDLFEHAAMRARREGAGSGSKYVQLA
jgi:hypothetical protein